MKTYLCCFLIFICTISSNFAISMIIDSSKYKKIESIYYDLDSNIILIDNDSTVFEGYLIYKFNRFKQNLREPKYSSEFLMVESYWLNNLCNFNPDKKDYYYMSNYFFYYMYATQDIGEAILDTNEYTLKYINLWNSNEFKNFKKLFFKYENYDSTGKFYYNISLQNKHTNIFDDSSVVFLINNDIDSIGYFIFKCSFSTAVLRYKSFYHKGEDENGNNIYEHLGFIKVLFPISEKYYFIPIDDIEFSKYSFKKAKWNPCVLYKSN